MTEIKIKVEFRGGLESIMVVPTPKDITLKRTENEVKVEKVIEHISENFILDQSLKSQFVENGQIRHGILVLINERDWELDEREKTMINDGDTILFTSTLHGG